MKTYICKECNIEFETHQAKANHVRWYHTDNSDSLKKISNSALLNNEKRFGKWVNEHVECSKLDCKNTFDIKYRFGKKKNKYFCSRSCANSRGIRSSETKKLISEKVSKSIKKKWENGDYCTANNHKFSSKNEREILKYFKENYPEEGWTSGGRLVYDSIPIVRDMYSDVLKICFEYDGVWHFKDIHNQLKHKKEVDASLEKWCLKNGYRLIRVDEDFYESIEQIKDLIYNRTETILKIGERY